MSAKKTLNDFSFDLKNLTNPPMIRFNKSISPWIAICFKASTPAFTPIFFAAPHFFWLSIACLAFLSASISNLSSADVLSSYRLSCLRFWAFLSAGASFDFSIFSISLSCLLLHLSSNLSRLSTISLLLFAPFALFSDSLVGFKFSLLFAKSTMLAFACFLLKSPISLS